MPFVYKKYQKTYWSVSNMRLTLFKLYSLENQKMVTFTNQKELSVFMAQRGLSRLDVMIIKVIADSEDDRIKINFLEETEKGLEFVYNADLFIHERENDLPLFSWTEDYYTGSPQFPTVNKTLKHLISTRQDEAMPKENIRYSIYDVYSARELV